MLLSRNKFNWSDYKKNANQSEKKHKQVDRSDRNDHRTKENERCIPIEWSRVDWLKSISSTDGNYVLFNRFFQISFFQVNLTSISILNYKLQILGNLNCKELRGWGEEIGNHSYYRASGILLTKVHPNPSIISKRCSEVCWGREDYKHKDLFRYDRSSFVTESLEKNSREDRVKTLIMMCQIGLHCACSSSFSVCDLQARQPDEKETQ